MYLAQKVKAITIISVLSIVTGILVMIGWIVHLLPFEDEKLNYVLMMFNSGLGFVLLGSALFITQFPLKKYNTAVFAILALLAFIIGAITLSQHVFNFNTGLDQFFITDRLGITRNYAFPGRMTNTTAVCFTLFSLSLFGFMAKQRIIHIVSQYLLHLITAITALAIINYLYGLSLFYDLYYVNSIAIPGASLFLLLSVTASLLHPSLGVTKLFTGTQVGNVLARRLLLLVILRIVIFGIFREQSRRYHLFSLEIDVSLLAVCFFSVGLGILWNTANWLNRIDKKRQEAEEEVKVMNETLERRVWDRTAELQDSLEMLKKSENNYHSLIEQASDAIYVLGFDGTFKDINAAMCTATGFAREELLQMNLTDIIDPEQLKTDPALKSQLTMNSSIVRERRFLRKNGEVFEVEINAKIIADDKIVAIARDITARKRMEYELREAELRFRTLAEKSIIGIYIFRNGKFSYVNPGFAHVFGYEPEELEGVKDPTEVIIDKEHRALTRENVRARMAGEVGAVQYECGGVKKDGSSILVEFYGSIVTIDGAPAIIGSMLDITERKRAEDVLKRSEANLKIIMETTDSAYVLMDRQLNVMTLNQMAVKLLNEQFNHAPVTGSLFTDFIPKEKLTQFKMYTTAVLKGNNISYEINFSKTDGAMRWFYTRLFPITNDKNEIFGLMLALSDISERKNTEDSLQTAYAQIKVHVNSLNEIAWKQSHLIRIPVTNLLTLVEMLQNDPSDEKILSYIKVVLERLDKVAVEMANDASEHLQQTFQQL